MMKVCWLLPSFLSVFLLGSTVEASTIKNWNFNSDRNQLNLTTDDDVQPKVQLVANPSRLVIDLPGVILGSPEISQKQGSIIQQIRLAQFDETTTRMVIDLAPGYTLDPAQVKVKGESPTRWSVQLPQPIAVTGYQPEIQDISVILPKSPVVDRTAFAGVVPLRSSMKPLEGQVKALMQRYSFLKTGLFFIDLDTGNYLDFGGDRVFPAASTIKLPILIAFFQDLDAGKVRLDEKLTMRSDLMTNGSGEMQYQRVGKKFSALETVTKMVTISDNTATNMIIDRLGGAAKLNQRFRSWGMKDTVINRLLADLRGTNTTSSKDMARVLALLVNNKLVSTQSKGQVLDILRHTTIKTLLPAGLGRGAVIANKTGDIGFLIGDAGYITTPNGKRYLGAMFAIRPYKDLRAKYFFSSVSRLVYDYLNQQNPVASSSDPNTATR